jgi:hypothetical protein
MMLSSMPYFLYVEPPYTTHMHSYSQQVYSRPLAPKIARNSGLDAVCNLGVFVRQMGEWARTAKAFDGLDLVVALEL